MWQEAENKELEKGLSMELLCAFVNNNARCYNESMEFAERVEDTLDDDHKVFCSLYTDLKACYTHAGCHVMYIVCAARCPLLLPRHHSRTHCQDMHLTPQIFEPET